MKDLVKVLDNMYNPITMWKADARRQERTIKAREEKNKKRREQRAFKPKYKAPIL